LSHIITRLSSIVAPEQFSRGLMPTKLKSNRKCFPTTAAQAMSAILKFLSSDGSDDLLHEQSKAGLQFLERDGWSRETHKMRMALMARRTEKSSERNN